MVRPLARSLTFAAALMAPAPAGAEVLVLQNDNFVGGSFVCNLGIGPDETIAARFTAPPSAYPYTVRRLHVLACSSSGLEQSVYALDMWHDGGTLNPGGVLWSSGTTSYLLDGSNGFSTIDLGGEGIIVGSGTIRVGLYHAFVFGSVGFATDFAITPQRNLEDGFEAGA